MSASSRRTITSDSILLRTIFARGTSNAVIPSSFVLTADGLGGTYWSTPYLSVKTETISSLFGNVANLSSLIIGNTETVSSITGNVGNFSTVSVSTFSANMGFFSTLTAFSSIMTSSLTVNSMAKVSSLVINTASNTMTYPMPSGVITITNTFLTATVTNPFITENSIIVVTPAQTAYSSYYYVTATTGSFTLTIGLTPFSQQKFNYAVISY